MHKAQRELCVFEMEWTFLLANSGILVGSEIEFNWNNVCRLFGIKHLVRVLRKERKIHSLTLLSFPNHNWETLHVSNALFNLYFCEQPYRCNRFIAAMHIPTLQDYEIDFFFRCHLKAFLLHCQFVCFFVCCFSRVYLLIWCIFMESNRKVSTNTCAHLNNACCSISSSAISFDTNHYFFFYASAMHFAPIFFFKINLENK